MTKTDRLSLCPSDHLGQPIAIKAKPELVVCDRPQLRLFHQDLWQLLEKEGSFAISMCICYPIPCSIKVNHFLSYAEQYWVDLHWYARTLDTYL